MLGEASDEQQALLDAYVPDSDEHRAEHALLAALRDVPPATSNADQDDAVLAAVLSDFDRDVQPGTDPARRGRTALRIAGGATLVAMAAAAAVWLSRVEPAPSPPAETTARATVPEPAFGRWRVRSGAAILESGTKQFSTELPEGVPLVAQGELCVEHAGMSACCAEGARFVARPTGQLTLLDGKVDLRATEPGGQAIDVGDLRVEPGRSSVFVIERSVAGSQVRVDDGTVVVVGPTIATRGVGRRRAPTQRPHGFTGGRHRTRRGGRRRSGRDGRPRRTGIAGQPSQRAQAERSPAAGTRTTPGRGTRCGVVHLRDADPPPSSQCGRPHGERERRTDPPRAGPSPLGSARVPSLTVARAAL